MSEVHLVSGLNAQFVPAQWDGKDTSGIRCVGTTVLVLMDECSEITKGGVYLTGSEVERHTMGAESGVLAKVSPGAFLLNEDKTRWTHEKPQIGERVYVLKYAGHHIRGMDGRIYRLMDYDNIKATFDVPETKQAA